MLTRSDRFTLSEIVNQSTNIYFGDNGLSRAFKSFLEAQLAQYLDEGQTDNSLELTIRHLASEWFDYSTPQALDEFAEVIIRVLEEARLQ